MPRKPRAKAQNVVETRTLEEIAEMRIAEWKRNPKKQALESDNIYGAVTGVLNSYNLRLKKVPEILRTVCDLELLAIGGNEIQELPRWIGELSALKGLDLRDNYLRTLPPEIGSL